MKSQFSQFLACPKTGESLELIIVSSNQKEGYVDVITGFLIGEKSRLLYPILRGVPRLFDGAATFFESEIMEHLSSISVVYVFDKPSAAFTQDFLPTLKSFSIEWNNHKISETTWGWTQEHRLERYLNYMNIPLADYSGKYFLDLGCGSGQLTVTLAEKLNGILVGVDLSFGLEKGELYKHDMGVGDKVLFVQANLMNLPFKAEAFDFVHSSGVLHHTPNTKNAFMATVPSVKKGGKLGIWVYRPVETMIPLIPFVKNKWTMLQEDSARKITTQLPPKLLYHLVHTYVLIFHVFYKLNETFRGVKHTQTVQERTTSLFDTLSPRYAWKHAESEVHGWFKEAGFTDLVETDQDNQAGFNIVGTKL